MQAWSINVCITFTSTIPLMHKFLSTCSTMTFLLSSEQSISLDEKKLSCLICFCNDTIIGTPFQKVCSFINNMFVLAYFTNSNQFKDQQWESINVITRYRTQLNTQLHITTITLSMLIVMFSLSLLHFQIKDQNSFINTYVPIDNLKGRTWNIMKCCLSPNCQAKSKFVHDLSRGPHDDSQT